MPLMPPLKEFVRESNKIEGILRAPTEDEIEVTRLFLNLPRPQIADISNAVHVFQPGAALRVEHGMDVEVGNHIAPSGRPEIRDMLQKILNDMFKFRHPYHMHLEYEDLHPYMDGNGRSGRLLWLWAMKYNGLDARLGFLHTFYYQALEFSR